MRLFHTLRTSFLLTTRLWKHNSCSCNIFIPGRNLRAPSRAFLNIYEKFQWLLLADRPARIYLRSVTSRVIVCYPITPTSRFWMCHTICWMALCQAFLSPPPLSKISSDTLFVPPHTIDWVFILGRARAQNKRLENKVTTYVPVTA